jgi:hypothetical protein
MLTLKTDDYPGGVLICRYKTPDLTLLTNLDLGLVPNSASYVN